MNAFKTPKTTGKLSDSCFVNAKQMCCPCLLLLANLLDRQRNLIATANLTTDCCKVHGEATARRP